MHPCSEEPGPNTRVALAYPEDNPLGGMWSGLKKAWEVVDSGLDWLCGVEGQVAGGAAMEKKQGDLPSNLTIKTRRPAGQQEEAAVQQLLMASCHCEIMPVTPTYANES